MREINRFTEVPLFNNEDEEAEYWANHCLGDELLETMSDEQLEINIEQKLIEKWRDLPEEKQQEVLDFTEFLYEKCKSLKS